MNRFFLYANPNKPESIPVLEHFVSLCKEKRCEVQAEGWLHEILRYGSVGSLDGIEPSVDAILSFGGDGTLLRVIPAAAELGIPILGINMGHTGFLLEIGPDELETALDNLLSKRCWVAERSMLSCAVPNRGSYLVMNEVALTRGQSPNSLLIEVRYNEELVFTIHGDGVLVSTATGTTAYSLSAGGPVVSPEVHCHVIVPVCSHIMHQRPVVLPREGTIRFIVKEDHGLAHQLSMDGQIILDMREGQEVIVEKARVSAKFIHFKPERFLSRLRKKQLEWGKHIYGGEK